MLSIFGLIRGISAALALTHLMACHNPKAAKTNLRSDESKGAVQPADQAGAGIINGDEIPAGQPLHATPADLERMQ